MKRLLICSALLAVAVSPAFGQMAAPSGSQATSAKPAPASPAETATATIGGKNVSISYSSPRVKGREGHIFTKDGLISKNPHYPVWRAGANGATTLKTEGDLMLGDLHVPAGTYTLFVDISDPDNWVLILNKKTGEWGLSYDPSQDLGKVKMQMGHPEALAENLTYTITDAGSGKGTITLAWERKQASVSVMVHQ